jgi:outer membrane scaffolding protein for murein synthesis (MipA/OmpV family)
MPNPDRPKHGLTLALGLLCMVAPLCVARADDAPLDSSAQSSWLESAGRQAAEWNLFLGGGFRIEPKFEGADDVEVMPVPMISADFGEYVSVDPTGLTIHAWQREGFSVNGRLGYDLGRDSDDDKHLDGLGDIGFGGVLGVDLAYERTPLEFKLSLDKTIGGSDGFTAKFGTAYLLPFDSFMLSIGPSVTWADSNYMESYFGVTDRQSRKSGLSRFDADAGIKRVDLEVSGLYFIDDHWVVRGEAGLGHLVGDAADSPVSQENLQMSTMFIVGYKF